MSLKSDSALGLPLLSDGTLEVTDAAIEQQVLALFDTTAPSLLRYAQTFVLSAGETEDVVQEAFLSHFYHLRIGRPRTNLRGWLFMDRGLPEILSRQHAVDDLCIRVRRRPQRCRAPIRGVESTGAEMTT
jgi:sigma-70-like protein